MLDPPREEPPAPSARRELKEPHLVALATRVIDTRVNRVPIAKRATEAHLVARARRGAHCLVGQDRPVVLATRVIDTRVNRDPIAKRATKARLVARALLVRHLALKGRRGTGHPHLCRLNS
jgi:hypothetical protein